MDDPIKWILGAAGAVLVIAGFLLTIQLKRESPDTPFGLEKLTYPHETKGWVMFFSGIAFLLIDIFLHDTTMLF